MRILYATRLFSGLETSIVKQEWEPTGVPTIHKIIARLDRDEDLHIVLASKGGEWDAPLDRDIRVAGLRKPVRVLSHLSLRGHISSGGIRDFRHAAVITRFAQTLKPNLVYIDHANVLAGALISRATSIPVLFRVMGVYPFMRQALARRDLAARLMAWAYQSPFAFALGTEDGSGSSAWLSKALAPNVKRAVLLNGVDDIQLSSNTIDLPFAWPKAPTVVLYVGKLEQEKGAEQFLTAFIAAARQRPGRLAAVMVGTGRLRPALDRQIANSGEPSSITIIDRLPHAAILALQSRADIYVSLNRLGNLSNANLEAMRVGAAMILPREIDNLIGEPQMALLSSDSYRAINSPDDIAGLIEAILELDANPKKRRELGAKIRSIAGSLIPSWEHRIQQEIAILQRIAQGRSI